MATKRLKRPRDPVQLAKLIGDIATGQAQDSTEDGKESQAVEFARKGGQKGGQARAKVLSAEERRKIAQKAARARWKTDADGGR